MQLVVLLHLVVLFHLVVILHLVVLLHLGTFLQILLIMVVFILEIRIGVLEKKNSGQYWTECRGSWIDASRGFN